MQIADWAHKHTGSRKEEKQAAEENGKSYLSKS
jgi:hypothetical protein